MKLMDNNGRLFGKISIVDVLVILVVAVLAVALHLKTNTYTHTSTAAVNDVITYQVLCRCIPDYVEGQVRVGDTLYDEDNFTAGKLGKITAVEYLPGDRLYAFQDGTAAIIPVEGTVNVLLTVEGEGLITDQSYSLNRIYHLGVNSARNFCTEYVRMTGTVYSIG